MPRPGPPGLFSGSKRGCVFILFYTAIAAICVFYVGVRVVTPLRLPRLVSTVLWVALVFIGFLGIALNLLNRSGGGLPSETLFPVATGVMQSCLFLLAFLVFARDVVTLPWLLVHRFSRNAPEKTVRKRRILFNITGVILVFAALFLGVTGHDNAYRVPDVREVEVRLPGLPKGLDGYRIAALSDLHVGGRAGNQWIKDIVTRTNAVGADAVVILGDVVDGKPETLYDDVRLLTGLRAPDGVHLILGNHEYISGYEEWVAAFRKMGLAPLLNTHRLITHNGARIAFAGITDLAQESFHVGPPPSPAKAIEGVPDSALRVLLSHRPRMARENAAVGYDLQLSGHTHGGQMLPGQIFVAYFNKYLAGLYQVGKMVLYVTRGTGHFGNMPVRVFAPSEISLLTLRPAEPEQ